MIWSCCVQIDMSDFSPLSESYSHLTPHFPQQSVLVGQLVKWWLIDRLSCSVLTLWCLQCTVKLTVHWGQLVTMGTGKHVSHLKPKASQKWVNWTSYITVLPFDNWPTRVRAQQGLRNAVISSVPRISSQCSLKHMTGFSVPWQCDRLFHTPPSESPIWNLVLIHLSAPSSGTA